MPVDPTKTKEYLKRASSKQEYEVSEFADKYDVTPSEAAAIIKRYGPSRARFDAYMVQRG